MNNRNDKGALSLSQPVGSSLGVGFACSSDDSEAEPSDSSGNSSNSTSCSSSSRCHFGRSGDSDEIQLLLPGPVCLLPVKICRMEPFASKTVQLAYMLAGISPESAISVTRSAGRSAMEHATEHIWHLGLEHPESGLVPTSDYDKIVTLQFINIWSTNILPALVYSPHSPPFADLAMVNKWIVSRRSSLSRRGPFWNGRSPCIAEVVVAPFADALLHGNSFIFDTQECSAVSSWLAAVRCMPFTRLY